MSGASSSETVTSTVGCRPSGSVAGNPGTPLGRSNAEAGFPSELPPNGNFNWSKAFKVGMRLFQMYKSVMRSLVLANRRRARSPHVLAVRARKRERASGRTMWSALEALNARQ